MFTIGSNLLKLSVGLFYRCLLGGGGGKVSLRYLNRVFGWQHISAENANLKESAAANKAFI